MNLCVYLKHPLVVILDSYTFLYYILLYTEEFVAHGSNVSCLSLGPSSGRVMVTGGEDRKVNMWAVGKPNVILVKHFLQLSVLHFCHMQLRYQRCVFWFTILNTIAYDRIWQHHWPAIHLVRCIHDVTSSFL